MIIEPMMTTTGVGDSDTMKTLLSSKQRVLDQVTDLCQAVAKSEWKNDRAKNNNAYVPTMKEHVANIVTHGVSIQNLSIVNYFF